MLVIDKTLIEYFDAEILDTLMSLSMFSNTRRDNVRFRPLSGGTNSDVGVVQSGGEILGVLKRNDPKVIQFEAHFLRTYEPLRYFPRVLMTELNFRYMFIEFMPGRSGYQRNGKATWLSLLAKEVLNHYVPGDGGWGSIEDQVPKWIDFLRSRMLESHDIIGNHVTDANFERVLDLAVSSNRTPGPEDHLLLHGDFGVHNFLFGDDGTLTGVIDPYPVLGPPIYDLVYAFCSSPDDLHWQTIRNAASELHRPPADDVLKEEVIIGLYSRISTCIQHHPHDLPAYLEAWRTWMDKLGT